MCGWYFAMARSSDEAQREWRERFSRMTLDEKLAELRKPWHTMAFYAAGVNATMLVMNILLGVKVFIGPEEMTFIFILVGLMLFMGAAPILGLRANEHARLAKRYGVYQRTIEHTALDVLYGVLVVLALGVIFNRANNFEVNAILLFTGFVAQVVLVRWAFLGKSPVKIESVV